MNQCRATTAKGERCENAAHVSQDVCWSHDPKNAEKRSRQASRAATAKADKEVREVKREIRELIRLVREEDFDVSKANAINRLLGTLLQYIIVERGIFREDDLAARIKELSGK